MKADGCDYEFQRRILNDFFCLGGTSANEVILEGLVAFEQHGGCTSSLHREVYTELVARCRGDSSDATNGT
jgi:hypothetical protein